MPRKGRLLPRVPGASGAGATDPNNIAGVYPDAKYAPIDGVWTMRDSDSGKEFYYRWHHQVKAGSFTGEQLSTKGGATYKTVAGTIKTDGTISWVVGSTRCEGKLIVPCKIINGTYGAATGGGRQRVFTGSKDGSAGSNNSVLNSAAPAAAPAFGTAFGHAHAPWSTKGFESSTAFGEKLFSKPKWYTPEQPSAGKEEGKERKGANSPTAGGKSANAGTGTVFPALPASSDESSDEQGAVETASAASTRATGAKEMPTKKKEERPRLPPDPRLVELCEEEGLHLDLALAALALRKAHATDEGTGAEAADGAFESGAAPSSSSSSSSSSSPSSPSTLPAAASGDGPAMLRRLCATVSDKSAPFPRRAAASRELETALSTCQGWPFDQAAAHDQDRLMQVVCEATQSVDERTRVSALRCLAVLVKTWRKETERFVGRAVHGIMLDAVSSESAAAACEAMQFWAWWVVDTAASNKATLNIVINVFSAKLKEVIALSPPDSLPTASRSSAVPAFDEVVYPILGAGLRCMSADAHDMAAASIDLLQLAARVYGPAIAPHCDGYMSALLVRLQERQEAADASADETGGAMHVFSCMMQIAEALQEKFARYTSPFCDAIEAQLQAAVPEQLQEAGGASDGGSLSVAQALFLLFAARTIRTCQYQKHLLPEKILEPATAQAMLKSVSTMLTKISALVDLKQRTKGANAAAFDSLAINAALQKLDFQDGATLLRKRRAGGWSVTLGHELTLILNDFKDYIPAEAVAKAKEMAAQLETLASEDKKEKEKPTPAAAGSATSKPTMMSSADLSYCSPSSYDMSSVPPGTVFVVVDAHHVPAANGPYIKTGTGAGNRNVYHKCDKDGRRISRSDDPTNYASIRFVKDWADVGGGANSAFPTTNRSTPALKLPAWTIEAGGDSNFPYMCSTFPKNSSELHAASGFHNIDKVQPELHWEDPPVSNWGGGRDYNGADGPIKWPSLLFVNSSKIVPAIQPFGAGATGGTFGAGGGFVDAGGGFGNEQKCSACQSSNIISPFHSTNSFCGDCGKKVGS